MRIDPNHHPVYSYGFAVLFIAGVAAFSIWGSTEAAQVVNGGNATTLADQINRRSLPVNAAEEPLRQAGLAFQQLRLENEFLGTENLAATEKMMHNVQQSNWSQYIDFLAGLSNTNVNKTAILTQFDGMAAGWMNNVASLNGGLINQYNQIQQQRKDKFKEPPTDLGGHPDEPLLIDNPNKDISIVLENAARQSIEMAKGIVWDGGLSDLLPGVQKTYVKMMDDEQIAYPQTLNDSAADYKAFIDQARDELSITADLIIKNNANNGISFTGLTNVALAEGLNEAACRSFQELANLEKGGFDNGERALMQAPTKKDAQDEADGKSFQDNTLNNALDAPKKEVAKATSQNSFGPPVETTWCESDESPERLVKNGPAPARDDVQAPGPIDPKQEPGGELGTVCGGKTGDPYWKWDCSCHCGDPDCRPEDIKHDDIWQTTRLECLNEINSAGHIGPLEFHEGIPPELLKVPVPHNSPKDTTTPKPHPTYQ